MHRTILLLCLLWTSAMALGTQYKLPSIYTPISQPIQALQYSLPYFHQFQTHHQIPAQSQSFLPFSPTPNYQIQQQQPLYPPNSLILVYYRPKAVAQPQPTIQTAQTLKPRVEVPQSRFSDICKTEGIIAHPDDCLKFIRCKLSLRHQVYYYEERSCPQGLAFDRKLESCNYQFKVSGCKSQYSHINLQTPLPTQTLLTYHGELPEPVEDVSEKAKDPSSNPSLYMMDLPQPLSDPADDIPKPDNNAAEADGGNIASVPLMGKNADTGVKSAPPTKTVKKPTSGTKKSPSRKVSSKRPSSGTKSSQGIKSKPVEQQKEQTEEPPRKVPQRVQTFSIGDSSESARMIDGDEQQLSVQNDQAPSEPLGHAGLNTKIAPEPVAVEVVPDKDVAGVRYEDDVDAEDDNYASTV